MKLIIYPLENNKLGIIEPNPGLTLEQAISNMPNNMPTGIVDSEEIDYYFAEAYEFQNGKVNINIEKAKEIHINKFRIARAPLLLKLDIEFMKAVETGSKALQKQIASKKQELRDITTVDLPNNLNEIKAVWPDILTNPFL